MISLPTPFKMYAVAGAIITIALMLGLHLLADNRLRNERDTAIKELADIKTAIALHTQAQKIENANKRLAADAKTKLMQAEFETQLKQRDLNREKSTQAIKDFYETRLDTTHFNYGERLRLGAERNSFGLPETNQASEGAAKSGRICDATPAYENLERACAITTLDFNLCRETLDNDTAMVGRDE